MARLLEYAQQSELPEIERQHLYHAIARQTKIESSALEGYDNWFRQRLDDFRARSGWTRLQLCYHASKVGKRYYRFDEEEKHQWQRSASYELLAILRAVKGVSPYEWVTSLGQANVDDDVWDDNYHAILVLSARLLIEDCSDSSETSEKLLSQLLTHYEQALQGESWEERRILLAIIAACLETMPHVVLKAWAHKGNLEKLLVAGARDAESFNSRRFALTGLSYLRKVTKDIVPVLVAGLQDNVDVVHDDAIEACRRFQTVDEEVIDELGKYLTGPSIRTAYGVSQMLAAIGTKAAGEDSALRSKIISLLVAGLEDEGSDREYEEGKAMADAFYDALLQVAGLPA